MKKHHVGIMGILLAGGVGLWFLLGRQATSAPLGFAQSSGQYQAVLETSAGVIIVELFADRAPETVANFVLLAQEQFYDGVRFHYVARDFIVQAGDPLSKSLVLRDKWGEGGPGYMIADELYQGNTNTEYTIAMAHKGPNTAGSQFFFNVADNQFLDEYHTVFGRVVEGQDVVATIEQAKVKPNNQPEQDIVIQHIAIIAK